jgi:UDPglucose 6-dehydrogenase
MPNVAYCENAYDCADGADALVIVTEWEQFRALDLERLRDLMATPVIVDLRNVYRPEEVQRHGFAYASVGRASEDSQYEGLSAGTTAFRKRKGIAMTRGLRSL